MTVSKTGVNGRLTNPTATRCFATAGGNAGGILRENASAIRWSLTTPLTVPVLNIVLAAYLGDFRDEKPE